MRKSGGRVWTTLVASLGGMGILYNGRRVSSFPRSQSRDRGHPAPGTRAVTFADLALVLCISLDET